MKERMKIKMPKVGFKVITPWHTPRHTHTLAQYDIHRKEDMPEKKERQREREKRKEEKNARGPDACYSFFVVKPWVVHTNTRPVRLFSVLRLNFKKGKKAPWWVEIWSKCFQTRTCLDCYYMFLSLSLCIIYIYICIHTCRSTGYFKVALKQNA